MRRNSLAMIVVLGLLISACGAGNPGATIGGATAPADTPPVTTPPPSTPLSAAPSASPVAIDTANWVPFASERYGYTVAHPPTWTASPATRDVEIGQRWAAPPFEESDQFWGTSAFVFSYGGYWISFSAFAVDVPADTSEERWMADYYAARLPGMAPGSCEYADAEPRPVSVDGHRGTMIVGDAYCGDSALIFIDSRAQVFELGAADRILPAQLPEWRTDKTDLLQALLGTVEFRP